MGGAKFGLGYKALNRQRRSQGTRALFLVNCLLPLLRHQLISGQLMEVKDVLAADPLEATIWQRTTTCSLGNHWMIVWTSVPMNLHARH